MLMSYFRSASIRLTVVASLLCFGGVGVSFADTDGPVSVDKQRIGVDLPPLDSGNAAFISRVNPGETNDVLDKMVSSTAQACRYIDGPALGGTETRSMPAFYKTPAEWRAFVENHPLVATVEKCCVRNNDISFVGRCEYADVTNVPKTRTVNRGRVGDNGTITADIPCSKRVCSDQTNASTCENVTWTEHYTKVLACRDEAPTDIEQPAKWVVNASAGPTNMSEVLGCSRASNDPIGGKLAHGEKGWVFTGVAEEPAGTDYCPWGPNTMKKRWNTFKYVQCLGGKINDLYGTQSVTRAPETGTTSAYVDAKYIDVHYSDRDDSSHKCAPEPPACNEVFVSYSTDVVGVQVADNRWRVGTVGDNYWGGSCAVYSRQSNFNIPNMDAVDQAKLVWVGFDDWTQLKVNGTLVYNGPKGGDRLDVVNRRVQYSASNTGSCELSTSWSITPNVDLKPYLIAGKNTLDMKTVVAGGGEAWFDIYLSFKGGYTLCKGGTGYTYYWEDSAWSACNGDSGTYWLGWDACSQSCGTGTQSRICQAAHLGTRSRTITCMRKDSSGNVSAVADLYCASNGAGTKPASMEYCNQEASVCTGGATQTQSCNTQACICPTISATPVESSYKPYNVTHGAWGSFMNAHAIWVSADGGSSPVAASDSWLVFGPLTFTAPTAGNYTFTAASDNYGRFYVDNNIVLNVMEEESFKSYRQATVYLSAGAHTIELMGYNIPGHGSSWDGNPGGIAGVVTSPTGSVVFDSRDSLKVVDHYTCPANYTVSGVFCIPNAGLSIASCAGGSIDCGAGYIQNGGACVSAISGLSLAHTANSREVTVSYSRAASVAGTCSVQAYNGTSWVTIGTQSCDDNSAKTYMLPEASWSWSGDGASVRLVTPSGWTQTFPSKLSCVAKSGSGYPTPDVDEDCDGAWDNTGVRSADYGLVLYQADAGCTNWQSIWPSNRPVYAAPTPACDETTVGNFYIYARPEYGYIYSVPSSGCTIGQTADTVNDYIYQCQQSYIYTYN